MAGDLIVEIRVWEDPLFHRDGDDLHHKVCISLWDSIVGKVIVIPLFDQEMTLDTRDLGTGIVEPGKRYAKGGGGMPATGGGRGALVLIFEVVYPACRLTDKAKEALKECVDRIILKP